MKVNIEFGAMAPPIKAQLARQALVSVPASRCSLWQRQADAITVLAVHALITEGEAHRARKRMIKKIGEHVQPIKIKALGRKS